MVLKRKAPARSRGGYRKRMRRGVGMRRVPRGLRPQSLTLKRSFYFALWQPSTASSNDFWRYYQFSIGQLPSINEFTALFDQYKINAIKFTFRPRYDNFAGNDTTDTTLPGVTNQFGTFLSIINDPYSVVAPAGLYNSGNYNSFCEQGNVKTYRANRPVSVFFRPTSAITYGTGTQFRRSPMFNSSNTTQVHNGFHVFAHDSNFSGSFGQAFDTFVTFYMSWRNLR